MKTCSDDPANAHKQTQTPENILKALGQQLLAFSHKLPVTFWYGSPDINSSIVYVCVRVFRREKEQGRVYVVLVFVLESVFVFECMFMSVFVKQTGIGLVS